MDYENKPEGYCNNFRYEMLKYLPVDAKTVIDIGCGDGTFVKLLKREPVRNFWGDRIRGGRSIKDGKSVPFMPPWQIVINFLKR